MGMKNEPVLRKKAQFKLGSILRARCPACHTGQVTEGIFAMRQKCPHCHYNLQPEPGFYLGAMAVGFLLTAMLTIPPTVLLKLLNVDIGLLVAFPFIEFIFVGSFLLFYCRILWLHLEYRLTDRLDGHP
jgi:uncharacterized protein (DUF983 family)